MKTSKIDCTHKGTIPGCSDILIYHK